MSITNRTDHLNNCLSEAFTEHTFGSHLPTPPPSPRSNSLISERATSQDSISSSITISSIVSGSLGSKDIEISSHRSSLTIGTTIASGDSTICQKLRQIWRCFCGMISLTLERIYRFCRRKSVYPIINSDLSIENLKRIYRGLGENKWMECIDGTYHHLGKTVFDEGLHKGTVEPGYLASMEKGFTFVEASLNLKIDADWYLDLHKRTCGHFQGDSTGTLMGQDRVGVFRSNDETAIHCNYTPPHHTSTEEGRNEFQALHLEIQKEFDDSYGLGEMTYDAETKKTCINFKLMHRDQVRKIFNKFSEEYYQEITAAQTPDEKLLAIAKLNIRLEYLHPARDGTTRTNIALMNKNLTENGFHPAILEFPSIPPMLGLMQWKEHLKQSLLKWEEINKDKGIFSKKEGTQNFCSERTAIAKMQGVSENETYEVNTTTPAKVSCVSAQTETPCQLPHKSL